MSNGQSVQVIRAFLSSVLATGTMLARGQLRLPGENVGRRLTFEDGTTSRVYRETVRRGVPTREPALLVVQFQLRLVGHSRLLHALFRGESIANTPLFAGFPGFRTKLWATDEQTGIYRGVYEWDGTERARTYATTLSTLLRLVCVRGSVRFHVEPGIQRDEFLRDPRIVGDFEPVQSEQWWRLRTAGAA
ncbi:MAG: YdhR family protein [Actinomycetota bacterium]|nr:YdhR family protein [Actinomycetota bacterium]